MIREQLKGFTAEPVFYVRAESDAERQELGLPDGVMFCWEHGGRRTTSPYEIIVKVGDAVKDGTFAVGKALTPDAIKQHHATLIQSQRQVVLGHLDQLRQFHVQNKMPAETIAMIDDFRTRFESAGLVDIDGMYRPEIGEENKQ